MNTAQNGKKQQQKQIRAECVNWESDRGSQSDTCSKSTDTPFYAINAEIAFVSTRQSTATMQTVNIFSPILSVVELVDVR